MAKTALPHWDMSGVYPGLDSPEFERDFRAFVRALDELEAQFDEARIDRVEQPLPADMAAHLFDHFVPAYNALQEQAWTLGAYIYSFVTTDSRDEFAQARLSEMEKQGVRLAKLDTRLTAWAGTQEVESLLERSEVARAHAYWLRRSQIAAQHLMSPA
jgi:oligoendopeptidase F